MLKYNISQLVQVCRIACGKSSAAEKNSDILRQFVEIGEQAEKLRGLFPMPKLEAVESSRTFPVMMQRKGIIDAIRRARVYFRRLNAASRQGGADKC